MNKSRLLGAVCAVTFIIVSTSSNAALVGRDLDGNLTTAEAYYDTDANLTWLKDANYALSNQFGLELSDSEFDDNKIGSTGLMTWDNAIAWIAGMNAANYGGANMWRLPTMMDTDAPGCDHSYTGTDCGFNVQTTSGSPPYPATTVYSEMASMFYDTLGNLAYYDTSGTGPQAGWGLSNTGPFDHIQSNLYWSSTEYAPDTSTAWYFGFDRGKQGSDFKSGFKYSWAAHSGSVGAAVVPIPPAFLLFGSGLLGIIGFARKKAA